MFKDETLEVITIKSDTREEKYVRDQLCQTQPVKTVDVTTQAILCHDIEVQTDFEQELPQSTRMRIDTSKSLSNFMLNVYPKISDQLIANVRSHAFDGYEVDWNEGEESDVVSCLHTLKQGISTERKVTSLTWNSTGSVIAAALGSFDHESWCVHQSFVCMWNIDRTKLDVNKPDKVIDSDTCLMSISFHSKQPAFLAGGDFAGKVYIWDMSQEDNPLVAYSGKDVISHQEPVSEIVWSYSPTSRTHELVSVGCDGNILVWEFNQLRKELKLNKKFLLLSENIPRSLRNGIIRNDIKIGITCLSFSHHNKNILFVGTENGGVFKCNIDAKHFSAKTKSPSGNISFQSPEMQAYEGHVATVNDIDASPHFEQIFLTCASDMTVHIYSTQQVKPLMTIEPVSEYLFAAKWSPTRPTVLFITTANGNMFIFDLTVNAVSPISTVNAHDKNTPIHALAFIANRYNVAATGDAVGSIKVWTLPNKFTQEKSSENTFFDNIETSEW